MANLRVVIFAIIITAGIIPIPAFAYDQNTHEGITQAIVQGYEKLQGDKFGSTEEQRIIAGSSAEDDDARFLNHFYDPINYRGLTVLGVSLGQPSEAWAHDTRGQASWRCIPYFPCSHDIEYNDKLFSSPTDYSWDRAIYEYVYGDKQRGLEAVGHVLHFIEDATVPAHVRNDQHGHWGSVGDADPYETFTTQFTSANITVPKDLSGVPTYSTLSSYLDHLARFTNTHFVSKDTMFNEFNLPAVSGLRESDDGFLYDKTLGLRIVAFEGKTDTHNRTTYTYSLKDTKQLALTDNWRGLSKEAIVNGIGIVDLFFKSVEEEKKTGALKAKNISAAEQSVIDLAKKGFRGVKALYGSSLSQSDVEELLGDNASQAGAAALAVSDTSPQPQDAVPVETDAPVDAPAVSQTNQVREQDLPPVVRPPAPPPRENPPPETPSQIEPASSPSTLPAAGSGGATGGSPTPTGDTAAGGGSNTSAPQGGGGGGGSQSASTPATSTPAAATPTLSLVILSPDENATYATTSVTFTGTTSAPSIVTAAFDNSLSTTTTDVDGNWGFTFTLSDGTKAVSFSAATSTETTATSTRTVVVDTTPPGAPSMSINECSASFTTGDCTVATTTVNISWGSVSGAAYYAVVKDNTVIATTTALTSTSGINASATTTFSVVAHKSNGTAATSTEKTVFVTTQPLIISEIAWAGTNASTEDEWLEVRNMTSSTLDLSHFVITTPDGSRTIPLSGTIGAPGTFADFFLIERSSEATSIASPNAVTVNFTQLSDSGEQLLLQWGNGTATTTVDSTPSLATCSGWCAGASNGSVGYSVQSGTSTAQLTMERKNNAPDGTLAASWQTTDAYSFYGNDRSGNAMYSTASTQSSKALPSAGWFCSPDTVSITSGAHYTPASGFCTYLMRAISTQADRYGTLYRGDVGSSTVVRRHFFGKTYTSLELTDAISGPQNGEHFFVAIHEGRLGPAFSGDPSNFETYFTTGAGAPPHSNYFVIPWVYGP